VSKPNMMHLFRPDDQLEWCFNVDSTSPLNDQELHLLRLTLADGFITSTVHDSTTLSQDQKIVEIGPRMNFATAASTNLLAICHRVGLTKITRIERSRRLVIPEDMEIDAFVASHHDRMTEQVYIEALSTFDTGKKPEKTYDIPLLEEGPDVFLGLKGISMDAFDRQLYYEYFSEMEKRDPTIVEVCGLNNCNCEHSRHGFFGGKQKIDGQLMPKTLFEMVKSTLTANPGNSVIGYHDNSSAIQGYQVWTIMPEFPGRSSRFIRTSVVFHPTLTFETHNFPTGISPFGGAETGTGGRQRDNKMTGRGANMIAGTIVYCVGNLLIPGYPLPWEDPALPYPHEVSRPLDILIQGSNGVSDYGNKSGEPVVGGSARSFDLCIPGDERWAWIKPTLGTGGIGQIDDRLVKKDIPVVGMKIVSIGGKAYRIGFGGGAASSMHQGDNEAELDFNAVQRGDAEIARKEYCVVRACIEMGERNPIAVAHDQGAGGKFNNLIELVGEAGGKVDIRKINLGDSTLSDVEIMVCEYQECDGLLIYPDRFDEFSAICQRENVYCENLGEITGDGRFVVFDSANGSCPVNLDLSSVLGRLPQKTWENITVKHKMLPVELPPDLTVRQALDLVLKLLCVGSKRFLTNKVDRSVTGLVRQQPCCGPLQLTVADVAIVAQSLLGLTGIAGSIGEQPIKTIVDPCAGTRMSVGEAITNLAACYIPGGLKQVKCSGNWMWAPKQPGEGSALYHACEAATDLMKETGLAVDGGKDSLSMATKLFGEWVKSPRQLIVSTYASIENLCQNVTPDIKKPGESSLILLDLAPGQYRLGGSALAQVHKQVGDVVPDADDGQLLVRAFDLVQGLIKDKQILSYHDRSDGGLITTLLEMAFAGNCGFDIDLYNEFDPLAVFYAEELGMVVECHDSVTDEIMKKAADCGVTAEYLGQTTPEKTVNITQDSSTVLNEDMRILRQLWEETSYQLERLQTDPECADIEKRNIFDRPGPSYYVSFSPPVFDVPNISVGTPPKVAILREEGSNGDREMTVAYFQAGFETVDVAMTDLISGNATLDNFQKYVAVGGFSFADVPDSAKGWALTIREIERLRDMFHRFHTNPGKLSLGVCNGAQKFGLCGFVPRLGIPDESQPHFIRNLSRRFESRWSTGKILPSPAVMLKDMADSILGVHVDHGEGYLHFPDPVILQEVLTNNLAPIVFVDDNGEVADGKQAYPFNPNGSPLGITALCTADGRHLAMMPHPERSYLSWQWHYLPEDLRKKWGHTSPWFKMFQNAYDWLAQS